MMLLGRTVWTRGEGGWERDGSQDTVHGRSPVDRLCAAVCSPYAGCTGIVFEPEGLAHQEVEAPKVSRTVFASLAKVRSEYPVVESEDLGWGIEPPEPMPGGSYATMIHYELKPGLARVFEERGAENSGFCGAWSLFTAGDALLCSLFPRARVRTLLILLGDFVAVVKCARGKRSFKLWTVPATDRDWKSLCLMVGDAEPRKPSPHQRPEMPGGSVAVVSDGAHEIHCPAWSELRAAGSIDTVLGLDSLADAASGLKPRHPGNLLEAFPRPLALDRHVAGATLVLALIALGSALVASGERRALAKVRLEGAERLATARERIASLEANRGEMEKLREEAPDPADAAPVGRALVLQALAEAIPDSLTLSSLMIDGDDTFKFEAIQVSAALDQGEVRKRLLRCGFAPATGGWTFDGADRSLSVRGRFASSLP